MGKKWKNISALALIASVPSQAMSEAPNAVYIDCEVSISQEGEEGFFVQNMGFKIDLNTSRIYEFDVKRLIHKDFCSENIPYFTLCKVDPGEFFAVQNYNVLKGSDKPTGNQSYKMISIDRMSGRLFGRHVIHIGAETPIEHWYNGMCQSGSDKARQRKKF